MYAYSLRSYVQHIYKVNFVNKRMIVGLYLLRRDPNKWAMTFSCRADNNALRNLNHYLVLIIYLVPGM